jgi:glutaredoxin
MLLQSRGIEYNTKLITFSKKSINEMAEKTGGKISVPQIFVDDKYFGGLLELKEYYKEK